VVRDVIERLAAERSVLALTGGAPKRNRGRTLAAICGDTCADHVRPGAGANPTEEQFLDTLDRLYPSPSRGSSALRATRGKTLITMNAGTI
jgi:hypothetical protein